MARPPRLVGFPYIGLYRYFLTICTYKRQPIFANPLIVTMALMQIRKTAAAQSFALLAYCFMPDHLHLLVEGTSDQADFKRFVRLSKQYSGIAHARRLGGGPLWQEGYHERVLRDAENLKGVARYLLNNPVRAGLVAAPIAYPYLGSDVWSVQDLITGST
jgi:REP-associated tyrosine transposase